MARNSTAVIPLTPRPPLHRNHASELATTHSRSRNTTLDATAIDHYLPHSGDCRPVSCFNPEVKLMQHWKLILRWLFLTIAAIGSASLQAQELQPIKALLICGGCCHDYARQKDIITQGISARANVEWVIAYDPSSTTTHLNPIYKNKDWYKGFDVVVHDECTADVKDLDTINNTILAPHKQGLPAVVLHCGEHSYRSEGWKGDQPSMTPWFEFTGLQSTSHWQQVPIEVTYIDKESPITQGLSNWTTIHEELYNNIGGKVLDTAHPLARGKQDHPGGRDMIDTNTVCAWTNMYNGKTRVFATTLGHNDETCADARYLDLITRGLLWSVDKLDEQHLHPAKSVLVPQSTGPQTTDKSASASAIGGKEKPANFKQGGHLADPSRLLAAIKGPKG